MRNGIVNQIEIIRGGETRMFGEGTTFDVLEAGIADMEKIAHE